MLADSKLFDAAKGRRFALTLAGAFALIALIALWRERDWIARSAGAIAAILLVSGMVIPGTLGPLERGWMKFAHALSRVTTPIFMGIVYFVVLTPAGFIRRTFGSNPLVHPLDGGTYWRDRKRRDREASRRRMERQF